MPDTTGSGTKTPNCFCALGALTGVCIKYAGGEIIVFVLMRHDNITCRCLIATFAASLYLDFVDGVKRITQAQVATGILVW